jgi:NADH pyrophosphatase NudC (nudix superfamily)
MPAAQRDKHNPMQSPFSYCPSCRSANIEFQQQKLIHCGDCNFSYFHNVATAVGAVIRCQNQILFAVRGRQPGSGMLDLPGGFTDPGESLEQALRREIREELNLEIGELRYLFSFANTYPYRDVVYRTADAIFEARLPVKPRIQTADDVAAVRWIDLQAVDLQCIAFESIRQAIGRLQLQDNSGNNSVAAQ